MASSTLEVQIKARDEASAKLKALSGVAKGLGTTLKVGITAAAAAAGAGILALGKIMGDSIEEAKEGRYQMAQLEAVIKSTGGKAGVTSDAILKMNKTLSMTNAIEDDVIMTGQNMLLTFTNIGKDTFPRATQAMLDMATKMNNGVTPSAEALKGQAIQLGKALNDPIAGLGALSRVGVSFTQAQKDTIKEMVNMEDIAGAQAIILKELETEFGGAAAAAGNVDPWQRFNVAMSSVKETIGNNLLPILADLATKLTPVVEKILEFAGPIIEKITTAVSDFIQSAIAQVSSFDINWGQVWDNIMSVVNLAWAWITDVIIPMAQSFIDGVMAIMDALGIDWKSVWEGIKAIALGIFQFFKTEIVPLWDDIVSVIVGIVKALKATWDSNFMGIQDIFSAVFNSLVVIFQGAWNVFKGVWEMLSGIFTGDWGKAWEGIKKIFKGIWDSFAGIITAAVGVMLAPINWLLDLLGSSMKAMSDWINKKSEVDAMMNTGAGSIMQGPSMIAPAAPTGKLDFSQFDRKARGGAVTGGTPYLVGERGPELFVPGGNGNITPNNRLGGVNIDLSGSILLDERVATKIGDMIFNKLGSISRLPAR